MNKAVKWTCENHVAIMTFSRPEQYNVINTEMGRDFRQALMECWDDDDVRAIVLTGSGNAFSGGGDIKFFIEEVKAGRIASSFETMMPIFHAAIEMLREIPKPVVAAVNGVVAGGGLGIALACDFRIASPDIKLFTAFTGIGASPDSSSSFFLPRFVGMGRATELFMRNKPLSAEEAFNLGIINKVVDKENVMTEAMTLAAELADGPTRAFGRTKQLLNRSMSSSLKEHLHNEGQLITISTVSPDFKEGVTAFVEKRKPNFVGK